MEASLLVAGQRAEVVVRRQQLDTLATRLARGLDDHLEQRRPDARALSQRVDRDDLVRLGAELVVTSPTQSSPSKAAKPGSAAGFQTLPRPVTIASPQRSTIVRSTQSWSAAVKARTLRGSVDLRLLELPRVVDVDRLPLGEDVERGLTGFAVAVAGVLGPAEREMHLGADRPRVDVRDPGLEVAHRAEGRVHVAGEDRRRKPELDPVRDADRLVDILHADQRGGGPEDLLLRDPHPGVDVTEDRRPVEVAVAEPVAAGHLAAGQELGALVLPDRRVRVDFLERALVDHRADVDAFLPAGAETQLLGGLDEARLQLLVGAFLDDHARGRGAALAGGAEGRPENPLDRELEIGVLEDDDRILAAQLEVDVLQVVGGVPHHLDAGLARASERDHGHVRMADEPVADLAPAPVDDVDHACRHAGLREQLDEALAEKRRVG